MTTWHPGLHRLWRVYRGQEECIGLVAEGAVPGLTDVAAPDAFAGIVSFVRFGPVKEIRVAPDGSEHAVSDVLPGAPTSHPTQGEYFATLEAAYAHVDRWKQRLVEEGWALTTDSNVYTLDDE
jgi:hypothetical protein